MNKILVRWCFVAVTCATCWIVLQKQSATTASVASTPVPLVSKNEIGVQPVLPQPTPDATKAMNPKIDDATRAKVQSGLKVAYSKAIDGLALTAPEKARLWELLTQRGETSYLANQLYNDRPTGSPADLISVSTAAKAQVDEEMRIEFGDRKYADIKLMLDATPHLLELQLKMEPAARLAGVNGLNGKQIFSLAKIMLEAYGSNSSLMARDSVQADDASGLTATDIQVIARANGLLSREQLSIFTRVLIQKNSENKKFFANNRS